MYALYGFQSSVPWFCFCVFCYIEVLNLYTDMFVKFWFPDILSCLERKIFCTPRSFLKNPSCYLLYFFSFKYVVHMELELGRNAILSPEWAVSCFNIKTSIFSYSLQQHVYWNWNSVEISAAPELGWHAKSWSVPYLKKTRIQKKSVFVP